MQSVVHAPCGGLRGVREKDVHIFRNVAYAAAPIGELRFWPPEALPPWQGVRDASVDGPVPPQGKSRLVAVTGGDFTVPQSEDCLTLTVTTPSPEGRRPVMVWIHGGGFLGGAGSSPWYAGHFLALREDVVVVSLNFRQGVLGHLYLPGVSSGNLALQDIVAGLRWVRDNIQAFGGDPSCVTVFGQSSGAVAALSLLDVPAAEGLFQRVISQSAPLGRPLRTAAQGVELGERFAKKLGVDAGDRAAFCAVPTHALLAAQLEFARTFHASVIGASEQPFAPVQDGHILMKRGEGWGHQKNAAVSVMIGTLREEQAAAYFIDPAVQSATWQQVADTLQFVAGTSGPDLIAWYKAQRLECTPVSVLTDLFTDVLFRLDTLRFADAMQRSTRCWVYQFDWPSPAGFGACHCLELPFVFGTFEAFGDAPMLKGATAATTQGLSESMQDAWAAFARDGDPNTETLPEWVSYANQRATLCLDRHVQCLSDLANFASHPLR